MTPSTAQSVTLSARLFEAMLFVLITLTMCVSAFGQAACKLVEPELSASPATARMEITSGMVLSPVVLDVKQKEDGQSAAHRTQVFHLTPKRKTATRKRQPEKLAGLTKFTCLRVQPAITIQETGTVTYKEWEVADWQGNTLLSRKSNDSPILWVEKGPACDLSELLGALAVAEKEFLPPLMIDSTGGSGGVIRINTGTHILGLNGMADLPYQRGLYDQNTLIHYGDGAIKLEPNWRDASPHALREEATRREAEIAAVKQRLDAEAQTLARREMAAERIRTVLRNCGVKSAQAKQ